MKWIKKKKKWKDIRYKTKFAWLPITIDNEVRWLERVWLKQERYETGWQNTEFLTEEEFSTIIIQEQQEAFSKQLACYYHCFDENCKYNNKHWCALGHEAMVDNNGVCHSREVK